MNQSIITHSTHVADDNLVRETVRGNDLSYAELMRRYLRSVYGFVQEHVSNEHAEQLRNLMTHDPA